MRDLLKALNTGLSKREKILSILLVGVLLFALVAGVSTLYIRKQMNELEKVKDTRLLGYESYIGTVNNIKKLYGIYDEASYQDAKQGVNLSPDLRNNLFIDEHYKGIKYSSAPVVEITDVRYEYAPEDAYKRYLVTLNTTYDNGKVTTYNVVLEYKDNVIIRMQGY